VHQTGIFSILLIVPGLIDPEPALVGFRIFQIENFASRISSIKRWTTAEARVAKSPPKSGETNLLRVAPYQI